jgi:hypothetical protein
MEWLCDCDRQVTNVEILWQWRDAASIGQQHGRFVSYRCRIGCDNCVREHGDKNCQNFEVRLTAQTKKVLVSQIVAQVLKQAPRGYVPKSDLQDALRQVHKARSTETVRAGKISAEPLESVHNLGQ